MLLHLLPHIRMCAFRHLIYWSSKHHLYIQRPFITYYAARFLLWELYVFLFYGFASFTDPVYQEHAVLERALVRSMSRKDSH